MEEKGTMTKKMFLEILRDRKIDTTQFRAASAGIARLLALETAKKAEGDVLLLPILRAGLALLPAFQNEFAGAPVGIIGAERDEATARARLYYEKIPKRRTAFVVILDPMLATGGSAVAVVEKLRVLGYKASQIYFTGVLASIEGMERLASLVPAKHITLAGIDATLDARKYIVPGLGDYGDRYFGTA